ncbi:MAG: hypothetical protein BGO34_01550 [Bacteroidia bacterium 44-10]|nr:MAG: hypothetical protein BGO34_01550 [Bacteroidia bacterium 44-10]
MDFNISDNTPIAALTVGQLKELLPSFLSQDKATSDELSDIPEVMNKQACCCLTGFKMATINKYVCERSIPHYKKGKTVLFKKSEVLEWLLSNRIQTTDEFIKEKDEQLTRRKGGK